MRPRGSHASASSLSSQLLTPDSPDPSSPRNTRSPSSSWHNSTPTLASLYSAPGVDFDNERLDRYSVAPPLRRSSLSSAESSVGGSEHGAAVRVTSSGNSALLPVYSIGKEKWDPEEDDFLHEYPGKNPRVGAARMIQETSAFRGPVHWGMRGVGNMFALALLVCGIVGVFLGYPIGEAFVSTAYVNTTSYIGPSPNTTTTTPSVTGTGGLINSNAPNISNRAVIDPDTPTSAYTMTGIDGADLVLVFSDEFNIDGRTFYMDEDPFWEMVDLHYWETDDLEWYDPGQATTADGSLVITLNKTTDADSHGLGYLGGMIQSWNKFCFTGGRIEAAVSLPGDSKVSGLWPSVWLLGNLGRAGYGASLDGVWPYSYDSCDIGTLANQTNPTTGGPSVANTTGLAEYNYELSYLPGQRLSRCTCPGENHPGPTYANGTFPGRAASEIDLFETTASSSGGEASQSAQWAPMNPNYLIVNTSTTNVDYYTTDWDTAVNSYLGGAYQLSTSALSKTNATNYNSTTDFSVFGVDYTPTYLGGVGTGEINWINQGEVMWMLSDTALVANAEAEVSQRPVTGEPMSIVANLGLSTSFTTISADLIYPAMMRIDYIRVYQVKGKTNIGCSPPLHPTADYIANNLAAYSNPNLTTYAQYIEYENGTLTSSTSFPKNRLIDTC